MATRKVEPLYLACDNLQSWFTWLGVYLNIALISWCLFWLAARYAEIEVGWPWFVVTFFVGLFVTDFVSGLVHWTTDTWFDEILYERIISIAREHHVYPYHIVGYGFRDYAGYSSWPTIVVVSPIVLPLTLGDAKSDMVYLMIFLCVEVALGMFFGTYAHRLGHARSESRVVRLLQRFGFLISPAYHKVHHSGRHDIRYCVINGWANSVCDRIGFWRGLERLVYTATGAVPRRNDREWFARFARDPSFMRDPIPSLIELRRDGCDRGDESTGIGY
jgi:ubiquitin-conjugating enzyme E2 variant